MTAQAFLSIIDHFRSALALAGEENLLCLHYADMIRDLGGAFRQIAEHVSIEHPPALMDELIEAAAFENMKANAERFAMSAREGFWRKDSDFFDSGTSRKWLGVLTDDDLTATTCEWQIFSTKTNSTGLSMAVVA